MNSLLYDDKDITSIIEYARKLENSTIGTVNYEQHSFAGKSNKNPIVQKSQNNKNKGGFGNYLEYAYFGKENDNKSQPDFPEAKLELKVSPLKTLSNYEVKVKERLVLNHFTFFDLAKENFENYQKIYTKDNAPYEYAKAQENIGNIFFECGKIYNNEEYFEEACKYYLDASEIYANINNYSEYKQSPVYVR